MLKIRKGVHGLGTVSGLSTCATDVILKMLEGGYNIIGHTQSGNRFITDKNKAERKYMAKSG